MILIVIILLVAYILVPLIDMILNERVRWGVKLAVYLLTFLYVLYVLLTGRPMLQGGV